MGFHVTVHLIGSPCDAIQAALPDLLEELQARPYLMEPRVEWDAEQRRAVVMVRDDSQTARLARGAVYEDIFEPAVAVLGEFEFIRVEVVEVRPNE